MLQFIFVLLLLLCVVACCVRNVQADSSGGEAEPSLPKQVF